MHDFAKLLDAIDMSLDPAICPGLVAADSKTRTAKREAQASLEEIVALDRASDFGADYVYFRRFAERPIVAVAYIYDWTERLADAQQRAQLADLHRRWWSASEIPLVFVFLPTQVQVYHLLQGPTVTASELQPHPFKTIHLAADAAKSLLELKQISARRLDDGTFWEQDPDSRRLAADGAAFMALSQEIGRCRANLVEKHRLDDHLVKRLLILFVMIKYLEERTDQDGNGVFPPDTFSKFASGARGFVDLLRKGGGPTLAFLDHLAKKDRFNGEVFQLDRESRAALQRTDLRQFADFLDARIEGAQYTFWRRYAFRELPVELISHLYEQFLPKQPGVVYTPPFLVNFILDEVLPLSGRTPPGFRLLDPACGSGVFLVGAFKRLVHRWRRDNRYRRPDVATLKALLKDHLFGVDVEPEAVRLTLFSLSVALCDFLDPRVIWEKLHFDALEGDNLRAVDFFTYSRDGGLAVSGFDVIVGNPPFVSKLSDAARSVVASLAAQDPRFVLPDKQVALLFLKEATHVAKPGGSVALIQPSLPLLYGEKAARFRSPFLQSVHVSQIVDLTHMSRVLFKRSRIPGSWRPSHTAGNPGDVAVAIVFAVNCSPREQDLLHVTVRRTVQADQKLMLEIDHYDLHVISRADAATDPRVWKANFIGGGRILHFLRRLGRLPTLRTYLEKMRRSRGWDFGEGYIAGKEEKIRRMTSLMRKAAAKRTAVEDKELKALRKRHRKAAWLTGKAAIPTEAFTSDGIDRARTTMLTQRWFTEPRRRSLFAAPVLLVKCSVEKETQTVPAAISHESIRFKDRIFGVHAPKKDLERLERVREVIANQRITHFHMLSTSSEYLVNRSTAFYSADLLSLPFTTSSTAMSLSPVEEALVDDSLTYVAQFKREGENASVFGRPSGAELDAFGRFFCTALGTIYESLKRVSPRQVGGSIVFPFYFGSAPSGTLGDDDAGERQVAALLSTTVGTSLRCQRILRVFEGNMLYLIKPDQRRYWLRSIALRDADEIFADLQERGF